MDTNTKQMRSDREANLGNNEEIYAPGICRECGKRLPKVKDGALHGQKELKAFACKLLHLCLRCYAERFPERKPQNLPSARRFHNGQWADIRPLMSWWEKEKTVRETEAEEVEESKELLPEEIDE